MSAQTTGEPEVTRYYEPYADVTPPLVKSKRGNFVLYSDYLRCERERDAAVRERDEARENLIGWMDGSAKAVKQSVKRVHEWLDQLGATPHADYEVRFASVVERLAAAEAVIEAAHDVVAWQGTAKEPEMYSALVSALNARTTLATAKGE